MCVDFLYRIEELWMTNMGNATVGTPEYCHANFPSVRILQSDRVPDSVIF